MLPVSNLSFKLQRAIELAFLKIGYGGKIVHLNR